MVSSNIMPPLGGQRLTSKAEFIGDKNLATFTEGRLVLHHMTCDATTVLLPSNVSQQIEGIQHEYSHRRSVETLIVVFKNGQRCGLELQPDTAEPLSEDALKEFQANCLMAYDI